LNETIDRSRGVYYARMDGDDIAYPERMAKQVAFLEAHAEMDLIGAWMLVFGQHGVALGKRVGLKGSVSSTPLIRSIGIAHPTFFGRIEWFRENRYEEWPLHFQDQQLLMKTLERSRFGMVPEILLGYREETLTIAKQWRYRSSYIRSFRNLLKRVGMGRSILLIAGQLLKLGIDVVAISTGLDYAILRHRATALTSGEREIWEKIWNLTK
jgi:hypothetical protein